MKDWDISLGNNSICRATNREGGSAKDGEKRAGRPELGTLRAKFPVEMEKSRLRGGKTNGG